MSDKYKKISCIINGRDCDGANICDDCYIAIEEIKREQEEINSKYIVDVPVRMGGRPYFGNHNNTVIKTHVDELELIKILVTIENPNEISGEKYIWDVAKFYPEWEKTKEVLKITETPDKILFEKNKPLIVVFGKLIYVISPKLDGSTLVE